MSLPAPFNRLRLPLIGSPLFIVSGPELVIAQCKAGVIGSFPALNARPQSQLDEWLHQITEELAQHNRDNPDRPAAPFAVNQIIHKTNDRVDADMATCEKWQVPMIITSLGPGRRSTPTRPKTWRFASVTNVLPGPKILSTGAMVRVPRAIAATAWAPPTAYTSLTPQR